METYHVLCTPVHEFQASSIATVAIAEANGGIRSSISNNPQWFWVAVLLRACWFLFFIHSFAFLRLKCVTNNVHNMRACECVMWCMVPEILRRQQLGVIEYKIVAGDYIKWSHTYIFYYVRVHIHFVAHVTVARQLVFVAVFENPIV